LLFVLYRFIIDICGKFSLLFCKPCKFTYCLKCCQFVHKNRLKSHMSDVYEIIQENHYPLFHGEVPDDILFSIFSYFDVVTLCQISLCSTHFYNMSSRKELWIPFLQREFFYFQTLNLSFEHGKHVFCQIRKYKKTAYPEVKMHKYYRDPIEELKIVWIRSDSF
jgi:hypothetical protein